jgi:hypothetical protein
LLVVYNATLTLPPRDDVGKSRRSLEGKPRLVLCGTRRA